MNNIFRYLGRSITRRFVAMMLTLLTFIMVGAGIVLWINYDTFQQYEATSRQLKQKEKLVAEIAEHTNQIFFRARGYYAFINRSEYDLIFKEKELLEKSLAEFKKLPISDSEMELIVSVESFFDNYFTNVLPRAFEFVDKEDYEGLRKFSSSGLNDSVNKLLNYAVNYRQQSEEMLNAENERLMERLRYQSLWFALYILIMFLISIVLIAKSARDIGKPLGNLSAEASRFARGEHVELVDSSRHDEIGQLSRSFQYMIGQIQLKEEELLAQNEELQAQQDELQAQQAELQEALIKTEANEHYLEKRNALIQSLTNTLDKRELLQSIVKNTVEVTGTDKGVIVLLNGELDYAAFGVSEQGVAQVLHSVEHDVLARIDHTKQPYAVTREIRSVERGYHTEFMQCHDLHVPLTNADDAVIAWIVLTRYSGAYTVMEQQDAEGLGKQISLSLEKLAMYEKTEEQRQLTQNILDTIQEGVQLLDLEGTTLQVNRKMLELFGQDAAFLTTDMKLTPWISHLRNQVVAPEPMARFIENIVQRREMDARVHIYEMFAPTRRFIQMYYEPIYRKQEQIGTLLVHRDITKEYEVDQIKSEFVSTVSHELRTPLASVLGFAELMLNKELKPERQRKYLHTIHQEALRLTSLINDFLDLQRMESGKQAYEMKPIFIQTIVGEVLELYREQHPRHKLTFDNRAGSAGIMGDRDKLRQVLMNLLSNAVKYSPEGGGITVTARKEGAQLCVDVKDEGLGIPAEALPKLFSKFYRVDNSDRREIGGTGLGLAIVKEIMNIHGGDIRVHSEYGRGSTFTFSLPVVGIEALAEVAAASETVEQQSHPAQHQKVMIIEDDSNLSELLTQELQERGFAVFRFADGEEALSAMPQIEPDAVVLDLVLEHGRDGWDIFERMAKDEHLRAIPIIISSAFEEKKKAGEWGAKGYLVKPYHPSLLSRAVVQAISSRESGGQIFVPEFK